MTSLRPILRPQARRPKPGATLVEVAIALSVLVTLILGMVDLGYGVFRHHVLSQSTRQLARHAIVRGKLAKHFASWGPQAIATTGEQTNAVTEFIAPQLVGWNLSDVSIKLDWPDGDNDVRRGDRVRVAMSAPYRPIITQLFSNAAITLQASSTMSMAH